MKHFVFFSIAFAITVNVSLSQEVISSSGNYSESSSNSLSWTIGELACSTLINSNSILTQGFQQSGISVANTKTDIGLDIKINVFPNPAAEYLNISIENYYNMRYQFLDTTGKILSSNLLRSNITKVLLSSYSNGSYILRLINKDNKTKTFLIVKH